MARREFPHRTGIIALFFTGLIALLAGCTGSTGTGPAGLIVDAGPAQTIVLANAAVLDASVTENGQPPQGGVSYTWSKLSGPGTVEFSPADREDTTARFSAIGSYVLALTVTSAGGSASGTVAIAVNLKAAGGSGLGARPSNTTECTAPASPPVATRIRLDDPFPGLPPLTAPVAMLMAE